MIDWSWELLSDAERTVLRRLSVFSGGASLEAAERVCAGEHVDDWEVLELLTALTEKSLVVTDGDKTPRYRMLGMVKEYAGERLVETGEAEPARQAHLAYFTELVETAEPHLRRAEQMEWMATLDADHDNITAALRGALAAGDAEWAMRMAGAAGWYWWLGGHKTEGNELLLAASAVPGEVSDEVRAKAYAFVTFFVTSGRSDPAEAAEWIRKAYEFSQSSQSRDPLLGLVAAMERLLHGPDAFVTAFEPLLASDDPWVRAVARLQLGKMRLLLGQNEHEADTYLETALTEFRAIGERWGLSFALTEAANRMAMRGEYAGACEYYEQAVAVVTEVGAIEDVVWMRSRQAQWYWMSREQEACAAAMAEAHRYAELVAWPDALAELALAKAEIARWSGDTVQAHRQLAVATDMLGDKTERASVHTTVEIMLGYLAESVEEAVEHHSAALAAVSEVEQAPLVAQVIVGIADLALRKEQYEQAARLLASSDGVRGMQDRSQPDFTRIEQEVRNHLGDKRFGEVTQEGARADWRELVAATLGR